MKHTAPDKPLPLFIPIRELFRAPHNGTPTSKAAAEKVSRESAVSQRSRIMDALEQHPDGLTDAQIQDLTGIDQNGQRPRRWQLVNDGLVADSGRKRKYGLHEEAVVWIATGGSK